MTKYEDCYPNVPRDCYIPGEDGTNGKSSLFLNPITKEWETISEAANRLDIDPGGMRKRLQNWEYVKAMTQPRKGKGWTKSLDKSTEVVSSDCDETSYVWNIPDKKAKRLETLRRKLGLSQWALINNGLNFAITGLEAAAKSKDGKRELLEGEEEEAENNEK